MAPEMSDGPVSRVRIRLGHLCRCLLGAVFILAGVLKGLDPAEFARQIAGYGILGPRAAALGAPLLIALEITLGAALLMGAWPRPTVVAAAALLIGFIGLEAYGMSVGRTESCGCFGAYLRRTPGQVIVEDLLFLGLGLLALWGLRSWKGLSGRLAGAATAGAAALALAFPIASPRLPIDSWVTGLAVGRSVEEMSIGTRAPGLAHGRHLVALIDLADPGASATAAALDAIAAQPGSPGVVTLTSAGEEEIAAFLWTAAPGFEVRRVDRDILKRLYRSLPRFFLLEEGRVVAVYDGAPPPAGDLL
jgi:uncharacterized membrane protein YphA (DoxX/SURF4 family)